MSAGFELALSSSLLHKGVFCLKSSIFNPQFLKEVLEEHEGRSGRKDTSEYSTVKQKLSSEKPLQGKCNIRWRDSEE